MYYFIINPNSRSGAGRTTWNELRAVLDAQKIEYQAFLTEYVGHAIKLTAKISSQGTPDNPTVIVAIGGDGTIHEVLTGIQDLDCVIFGYIPTGSGNDFCRSMKLPQNPKEALASILKKERIVSMDVPYVTQGSRRYRFGISAGTGYDAAVCQEVLASPVKKLLNRFGLGKLVYLLVALRQLIFLNPTPMTLYMDGGRKRSYKKVYFAAVMNQKFEGGGFMFCPRANPADHILDVIVVEGMSRLKVLCCLPTAFFGKHTRFKGVHILRCKSIEINSAVPLAIHKDGESGGIKSELCVALEKKPLKIIMPVR